MSTRGAPNTASAPAMRSAPSARPYKDFLTPALHRRFTNAAGLVLAICWLEAILMSSSRSLIWTWFPFGIAGVRALLLFTPALAVFIIRVMNMHVGKRTTTSAAETVLQKVTEMRPWATMGWYMFSAWFYGEVYIWARSANAGLGWVDPGNAYERPRVNENPALFRFLLPCLAVVQTYTHIRQDYDRILIEEAADTENARLAVKGAPSVLAQLLVKSEIKAMRIMTSIIPSLILNLPFYYLLFRHLIWNFFVYPVAITLVRQVPPNNGPTGLTQPLTLVWQIATAAAMLMALWELSNVVFTIYVSTAPLKREEPLTSGISGPKSSSTDPNGSLIRGLRAKKDVPRSFAYWELYIICTRFESRRKSIFQEYDRKDGSSWSQISQLCLAEVSAVSARIAKAQAPVNDPRKTQESLIAQQQQAPYGLPKIAQQKVLNDRDVLQKSTRNPSTIHNVGNMARSVGQSPASANPMVEASHKAIEYGIDRAGGRDAWSRTGLQKAAEERTITFLRMPVGASFRRTFARTVKAVVFGVPHSDAINIVHASKSLVELAVCSLREDDYGQAAKDVPAIIRTYTAAVRDVRTFVAGLAPHWSDVEFTESDRNLDASRHLKEVKELVEVLRSGVEKLILHFEEYAGALGLSKKELREAKDVVAIGNEDNGMEMEQVKC